jgi:predicted acylesterase/phospholipase RssA
MTASPRWWTTLPEDARWHGVFQGGGAKGVAYSGALKRMVSQSQWFCSAAGSSAGALTACLIAAGFHPDEFAAMTTEMLRAVRPQSFVDRTLYRWKLTRRFTRYSSIGLEIALERRLREGLARHGGDGSRDVTFEDLLRATGISLYVLALDATVGRPVPFCAERTPKLSVSAAVAASCAIPLAFPPRYMEVDLNSVPLPEPPLFRRLVDGGAWANFPAFIYNDAAFREHFALCALPPKPKVIGFVFESDTPLFSVAPLRFIEDPHKHMYWYTADLMLRRFAKRVRADDNDGLIGQIKWRLSLIPSALGLGLGIGALGVVGFSLLGGGVDAAAEHRWVAAGLYGVSLLIAAFVAFVGRRLLKAVTLEGLETFRSVLGLATAPAIWAGLDPRTTIILLPTSGIDTTDFDMSDGDFSRAVQEAEDSCGRQLAAALAGETFYVGNRRRFAETQRPEHPQDLKDLVPTHSNGLDRSR